MQFFADALPYEKEIIKHVDVKITIKLYGRVVTWIFSQNYVVSITAWQARLCWFPPCCLYYFIWMVRSFNQSDDSTSFGLIGVTCARNEVVNWSALLLLRLKLLERVLCARKDVKSITHQLLIISFQMNADLWTRRERDDGRKLNDECVQPSSFSDASDFSPRCHFSVKFFSLMNWQRNLRNVNDRSYFGGWHLRI